MYYIWTSDKLRDVIPLTDYTYIVLLQDLQCFVDIVQMVYSHMTPLSFLNVNKWKSKL
jgi:hypothetical protein